jgi:hypothetical protein
MMELTEGSETSANHNLTPGKYPKEHIQYSKHGESLKSRKISLFVERELILKRPHTRFSPSASYLFSVLTNILLSP